MSRQVRQFCPRDSVPAGFQIPVDPAPPEPIEADAPDINMTWQQKQNFGPAIKKHESKSKVVRWTPLDLEAVEDLPVTSIVGDGPGWSEQQADFDIGSKRQQRQPRDQVKGGKSSNSNNPNPAQPAEASPTLNDTQTPHKRSRNRRTRSKAKKEEQAIDMDPLPHSAYVPPHMRRRAAAGSGKEAATNPAPSSANGATNASQKSSTAHSGKAQSTPNRASNTSRETPSPLTTPQDLPRQAIKVEGDAGNQVATPASAHVTGEASYNLPEGLAWDTPKPQPPPVAPRKENPRWPRTRGPGKHVWPKQSEMRARSSESSVDGGVECRSDSNGDSQYDVKKLVDWNGDWMPAPESWQGRKGHVHRDLGQYVEAWIEGHPKIIRESILEYEKSPSFLDYKEIVPRFWVVNNIEQGTLAEFWTSMPTREPRALSDTSESPPFWERYKDNNDVVIEALEVPDAKVDPGDLDNHRAGQDLLASAEDNLEGIEKHKQRRAKKSQKKQNRPAPATVPTGPQGPDRRIIPKANVYFRPFQPRDVEGITAIYNHYVEETIYANEFEARTAAQIHDRINIIVGEGLPYLVAIAKGNHAKKPTNYVQEKVVGFANLDDYCDRSSMYRYSFELELFVHPGYTSQNIASCLLDALLNMCNTGYSACGGYEYRNESEYLKMGPKRVIKTITLPVCKDKGESADATSEFLKRFKFVRAGHIPQVGYKFGKVVDVHTFRHTTSEDIDANGRPTVPH